MSHLFDPLTVRGITLRNRIGVSPMCQYSSKDGLMSDWHLVHLGSRAVGGAGLVMTEASAVEARGRISPEDAGIWSDKHIEPMARIAKFVSEQGAVPGIQIAHAGRKASTAQPWKGGKAVGDAEGGWEPVAPSAIPFDPESRMPRGLSRDEIADVQEAFRLAAVRARQAGFKWLEFHAAHGYLAHSFLSPFSNQREDSYGGSFENRIRFVLETTRILRKEWSEELPFSVRLSCTDWAEGGWTIEDSIELSKRLKSEGVDLIDCSSGGGVAGPRIPVGASYQVPFAEAIRREAGIPTAAVGMITDPMQADDIIRNGRADMILLARQFLRDPYWPLHAARALHQAERIESPVQYGRAF